MAGDLADYGGEEAMRWNSVLLARDYFERFFLGS
jgi:hypothetical protein